MTRHARIEIVPPRAECDPHRGDESCPHMEATQEQCLRYFAPSSHPHHLRLVASNGITLAHSEDYTNLDTARRAIDAWERAVLDVFDARPEDGPRRVVVLDIDHQQVRP